jgi:hypothetical protein
MSEAGGCAPEPLDNVGGRAERHDADLPRISQDVDDCVFGGLPVAGTIPATTGQRAIRGGLWTSLRAMRLGQGGPVAAAGSRGMPGGLGGAS